MFGFLSAIINKKSKKGVELRFEPITYDELYEMVKLGNKKPDLSILKTLHRELCIAFDVDESEEALMFLANAFHETGYLSRFSENLNYTSTKRLREVFPSKFKGKTEDYVLRYVKNPQGLANLIYGGRFGNTDSNDGWRYRGRGLLQLTFKDNYIRFNKKTNGKYNVVNNPDCLSTPIIAIQSALCYYKAINNKNTLVAVRRGIAGSNFGLTEVKKIYEKIKKKQE